MWDRYIVGLWDMYFVCRTDVVKMALIFLLCFRDTKGLE